MHEDDGYEDGMTHSLLNALPEIVDDGPEVEMELKKEDISADKGIAVAPEDDGMIIKVESLSTINVDDPDEKTTVQQEHDIPDGNLPTKQEDPANDRFTNGAPVEPDYTPTFIKVEGKDNKLEEESAILLSTPEQPKQSSDDLPSKHSPTTTTPSRPTSPDRLPPALPVNTPLPSAPSSSGSSTTIPLTPSSLSFLLTQADALYELYPPTHPGLALSSIMGPQSVVYTWCEPNLSSSTGGAMDMETEEERSADDEAEAMVACPWLVVYPYIEKDEHVHVDEDQTSDEEVEEEGWRWWGEKRTRSDRKGKGKEKEKERMKQGDARGREKRNLHKLRKSPLSRIERRSVLAGAVVVLGIAIAFYGARVGRGPGVGWDVHERSWRGWRWIGGGLVGVTNRIIVR
jgi:hypothetical protein